jgi:signal transduction histidine kinase
LKLLTRSTYYFLIYTSFAFISGGVILHRIIEKQVYKQIDTSLITEKTIIEDQIEQSGKIPDFGASFGHQIEVRIYDKPLIPVQKIYDTIVNEASYEERNSFRYLYFADNTSENKGYTISIFRTLEEKNAMLEYIGIYMFFLFLSLFLISFLFNYFISRKLWAPFQEAVKKAEIFDIQSDKQFDLPDTDVMEFRQLNDVLSRMTGKMRKDYLNLKEYNENAAHEIRTPLSVIRSKVELLAQREEMGKESINILKSINDAVTKLFKLNDGLLLISKIQNLYFQEEKVINLKNIIEQNIDNYGEILSLKRITFNMEARDPAVVKMNETLAEILISNLLSNAVRYNVDGGFIRCTIDKESLSISNSGLPLKTDPETLFHRFHKSGDNPQSVGLGLSIVKKISEAYNMNIIYKTQDNIHILTLTYPASYS